MSIAGYAVGAAALVIVVAATTVTGIYWRRKLLPEAAGSVAASCSLVLAVSALLVVAEILGTVGWLSRWPVVAATVAVATASVALGHRERRPPRRPPARPGCSWVIAAAAASVALLLAQSLLSIRSAGRSGIYFVDALGYHLPWASHFAASHETTSIVHFQPGAATSYYSLNDELLRGISMGLLGRDSANLLIGPLTVAAVLLAVWSVGAVIGRGALAVCVVAPLLATYGSFIASGLNDWAAIWPLVAALGVLLHLAGKPGGGRARPTGGTAELFVVGLALGIAAGTKLSALVPVGLFALGVLVVVRDNRWRSAGLLVGGAMLTGGYWFVRNAVDAGTPLPAVHLPGLPRVPMSTIDKYGFSVAHYLGDGRIVSDFFVPGLRAAFGPLWPVLFGLLAIGLATSLWRPIDPVRIVVAGTAVVGLIAYVATPTTALGPPGYPLLFAANTRYAWPPITLGLLLLVLFARWRWWPAAVAVLSLAVLVAQFTVPASWGSDASRRDVVVAASVSLIVVGAVTLLLTVASAGTLRVVAVAGCVAAVLAGYPLQRAYLEHRYHDEGNASREFIAFMQRYDHTSIGIVGVAGSYPLEGESWTNSVTYIGASGHDHSFEDYGSCAQFLTAVREGGYDLVAVGLDRPGRITGAEKWLATDSSARTIFHNAAATVFDIRPGFGRSVPGDRRDCR